MSFPSICIPRVSIDDPKQIRQKIYEAFSNCFDLKISRIDVIERIGKDNRPYHRAFIHFTDDNTLNDYTEQIKQKLINGETLKLVYDEPAYWRISASRLEKPRINSLVV